MAASTVATRCKSLRIPPYGMVKLGPEASRIIQMKPFLRLQHLKQLGFVYLIYPSATHTRFEHSIGTSFLARKLGKRLHRDGYVTKDQVTQLELAALMHDIGHGPFSHAYEHGTDGVYCHEKVGCSIVEGILEAIGHPEWTETVQDMIMGKVPPTCTQPFLYEIVANARSGLDVDKMDYLLRDHLHCFGAVPTMDPMRIIDNLVIVDGHLAVESKEAENVLSLFALRAKMHSIVYQHRVAVTADLMFAQGLKEADLKYDLLFRGTALDDRFLGNMTTVPVLKQLDDRELWTSKLYEEGDDTDGWTTVERKIHYGKGTDNPLDYITFVHNGKIVDEPCADLFLPRAFQSVLKFAVKVP